MLLMMVIMEYYGHSFENLANHFVQLFLIDNNNNSRLPTSIYRNQHGGPYKLAYLTGNDDCISAAVNGYVAPLVI